MRRSHTAVVERNSTFDSDFATEPYECAWAGEARWFIRVLQIDGPMMGGPMTRLSARAQVSPDGLNWCDEGSKFPDIRKAGLYTLPLRDFGGWLRLDCQVGGRQPKVKVLIYLVLKE
jgi:hypothetical protein